MTPFTRLFTSSVGKKYLLGVSGLMLSLFAISHLAGNLLLIQGREAYNDYAAGLHAIPGFLFVEWGLAAVFILHIVIAIKVSMENNAARGRSYSQHKMQSVGKSAATMKYSGSLLLVFLVVHLLNLRFKILPAVDVPNATDFDAVQHLFANAGMVGFYVVMCVVVGFHLGHGLQSSLQSLGWYHTDVTPRIRSLSFWFGLVMAVGYASLPLYVMFNYPV